MADAVSLAKPAESPAPSLGRRVFRRVLAVVRRASKAIYLGMIVALLGVVYVTVIPVVALFRYLGGAPPSGWRARDDREVGSMDRLRSLY